MAQSEVAARFGRPAGSWRLRAYTIIFEADTRAGRLFDVLLIATILASVAVVGWELECATKRSQDQCQPHCLGGQVSSGNERSRSARTFPAARRE